MTMPQGLPSHARRVYNGSLWQIWVWEQKEFNGSMKIYERAVRTDSVTVIPAIDRQILIERQEQPGRELFISLPGGFQEADDPVHDAKRELQEETGYISDDWYHYFTWSPPASKLQWSNHFYIARNCRRGADRALDPGERITLELTSFEKFLTLADDPKWRHQDLVPTMLQARYVPEKREELRVLLFGQ